MTHYRAIFFDAGFTLLEMNPSWTELFLQVTRSRGLAFTPADVARADDAAQVFFDGHYYQPNDTWADDAAIRTFWLEYYRTGLRAVGCPPELLDPCAQDLAHLLDQSTAWRAYAEAIEVLAGLKAAGYTIGILSDWGSSLPHILEAAGLRPYADFLVVSAIEGVAKPRPSFFQHALDRAGVLPHQALMVGDNLYADIHGAARAGIAGVLIDRDEHYPAPGVPSIRQLGELWPHLGQGAAMAQLAEPPCAIEQYRDASQLNARVALHARFSTNPYGWQRWVWDQLKLAADSRVLELGCGPGYLWTENQDRVPFTSDRSSKAAATPDDRFAGRGLAASGAPAGWRVTLSDLSPGMIQRARSNLGTLWQRFLAAVADAQSLPFPPAAFDAVIANHMLYHVPDRARALREIRRVLRPGGRLYAATVGPTHLRELDELVLGLVPEIDPGSLGMANPFTLENGGAQLARWFSRVTVRRYQDSLRITAAEPLVAYILSTPTWVPLVRDQVDRLTRHVRERLAADGVIAVTKDSGLFVAW